MDVYSFDPLDDPRWAELVGWHPKASVFHTAAWLEALRRTYGFEPVAFTTSPPTQPLRNALVFCAIRSWLTGRRLVSLPFSDHCEPLAETAEELELLCGSALRYPGDWRSIELRPTTTVVPPGTTFCAAERCHLHRLDLRPDLDTLWRSFHRDSIQRKIRRAEREGLSYQEGRSGTLLGQFRHLLDVTRRRHQVPLQPLAWFRNLIECLGENLVIRVVSKDGRPVAGILTLTHRDRAVYKYGGSDAARHPLGGMPYLFWRTIQDAKRMGAQELDLGRSDHDNAGLIAFKDRWGARRTTLTYWRAGQAPSPASCLGRVETLGRQVIARLPGPMRRTAGGLLYRHFG